MVAKYVVAIDLMIKINFLIIVLIFSSCNNSSKNDEKSLIIIQQLIDDKYKKNQDLDNLTEIKNDFNNVYQSMKKESILNVITKYKGVMDKTMCEKIMITDEYSLLSIKLLELSCLDNANITYDAKYIKPLYVSSKNQIKLGETYTCEIFLSSLRSIKKPTYYVEYNNERLEYKEGDVIPIFQVKPNKKGKQEYNLNVFVEWNGVRKYPLTVNFDVE